MNPRQSRLILFAISFVSLLSLQARAQEQDTEQERLTGFAKHQKDNIQYGKAREQGERAYLEEEEQWENKKERELQEYKKQAKKQVIKDEGPEFKEDAAQKKKLEAEYEKNKEIYAKNRAKRKEFDRNAAHLPTEAQELGLDQDRPRYDYRKRASFGATPKYGKNASSSSGRSSGGSSGSFGGGGGSAPSFPPPPSFDDFNDGGYMPAPTLDNNEYMGDIPPPPPPPPPFGGDGGGFSGEGGDFPPPPPPTFGDDGGDF